MALPPPEARYPLVSYLKAEKRHIDDLNRLLARAAKELSTQIASLNTGRNPLTRMQLEATRAAIRAHLDQDFSDIEQIVRVGQRTSAAAASQVVSRYENELLEIVLTKSQMELIAAAQAERSASTIRTVLARILSSERPLSTNVYNTKALVNGWVNDLVNVALLKGANSATLARDVRKFISPNTPGGASYAAKRLARTEINNAFHASSIDRYQRSRIIEEVDWHLSTSHPEGDRCDALAADGPYPVDEVPEKPHPQCFCYTTPALPSREKFIDDLLAGKYDDEPWFGSASLEQ